MRLTVTTLLAFLVFARAVASAQDGTTVPYEPIISCTDPRTLFMQGMTERGCTVRISQDVFQVGIDGLIMRSQTCDFSCPDTSVGSIKAAFELPVRATNTPPGTTVSMKGPDRVLTPRFIAKSLSNQGPVRRSLLNYIYGKTRSAIGRTRGPVRFERVPTATSGKTRGDDAEADDHDDGLVVGGPFDAGRETPVDGRTDVTVTFVGWSLSGTEAALWDSVSVASTVTEDFAFVFAVDGGNGWLEVKLDDETIWAAAAEDHEPGIAYLATIPSSVLAGRQGLLLFILHNDDLAALSEVIVGDIDTTEFSGDDATADTTPPSIACAPDDGSWKATNVAVACQASDDRSGLAHPSDALVMLTTSVANGLETAAATTDSREICDAAGNCAIAGPIDGLRIDRKAPAIALTSPNGVEYVVNENVRAQYSCADGGSGVAACAGDVASGGWVATAAVGTYDFRVASADLVGNTAIAASAYRVTNAICVLYDQSKAVQSGRTMPIKLRVCDVNGANLSNESMRLTAQTITDLASGATLPLDDAGRSNADRRFRYDPSIEGYVFNLSTGRLGTGTYRVTFTIDGDAVAHEVLLRIR